MKKQIEVIGFVESTVRWCIWGLGFIAKEVILKQGDLVRLLEGLMDYMFGKGGKRGKWGKDK